MNNITSVDPNQKTDLFSSSDEKEFEETFADWDKIVEDLNEVIQEEKEDNVSVLFADSTINFDDLLKKKTESKKEDNISGMSDSLEQGEKLAEQEEKNNSLNKSMDFSDTLDVVINESGEVVQNLFSKRELKELNNEFEKSVTVAQFSGNIDDLLNETKLDVRYTNIDDLFNDSKILTNQNYDPEILEVSKSKKQKWPSGKDDLDTKNCFSKLVERIGTKWDSYSPRKKTLIKVLAVVLALIALVGLGILITHFAVGLHVAGKWIADTAGKAGHWIANTAWPAIKNFSFKDITAMEGLLYIGLPSLGVLGGSITGVVLYKRAKRKKAEQVTFIDDSLTLKIESNSGFCRKKINDSNQPKKVEKKDEPKIESNRCVKLKNFFKRDAFKVHKSFRQSFIDCFKRKNKTAHKTDHEIKNI